jgi:hypothetical protein
LKLKKIAEKNGLTIEEDSCPIHLFNELPKDKINELDEKFKIGSLLIPYCKSDDCENCWDIEVEVGKYLKPIHPNMYVHKSGAYGKITGYTNINNKTCYVLTWEDGMKDQVLLESVKFGHYEIVEEQY